MDEGWAVWCRTIIEWRDDDHDDDAHDDAHGVNKSIIP